MSKNVIKSSLPFIQPFHEITNCFLRTFRSSSDMKLTSVATKQTASAKVKVEKKKISTGPETRERLGIGSFPSQCTELSCCKYFFF